MLFNLFISFTKLKLIVNFMQATLVAPVRGKMFKGLCLCYTVIAVTFLSVGISGYWTFGNKAMGTVLSNFMEHNSLPSWLLILTNTFCFLQVSAVAGVRYPITLTYSSLLFVSCIFFCLNYELVQSINLSNTHLGGV